MYTKDGGVDGCVLIFSSENTEIVESKLWFFQ